MSGGESSLETTSHSRNQVQKQSGSKEDFPTKELVPNKRRIHCTVQKEACGTKEAQHTINRSHMGRMGI